MGTINFVKTADTEEYVFNKNTFKFMYTSYTSGATGTVYLYFAAEGDIVDPDTITLTVTKRFMSNIIKSISESLNSSGHNEIKHSQTSGIYSFITAMTYTAG